MVHETNLSDAFEMHVSVFFKFGFLKTNFNITLAITFKCKLDFSDSLSNT